jgi:hypothetical protein
MAHPFRSLRVLKLECALAFGSLTPVAPVSKIIVKIAAVSADPVSI